MLWKVIQKTGKSKCVVLFSTKCCYLTITVKLDKGDFVQLPAKWLVCAVDLTGLTADEALNRLLAAHELQATQPNTLASGTALEPLPPVSPSPLVSPTPSMLGADLMAQQPSGMRLTSVWSGASPGWPEDPSQSLMPLSWPQSLMQHAQWRDASRHDPPLVPCWWAWSATCFKAWKVQRNWLPWQMLFKCWMKGVQNIQKKKQARKRAAQKKTNCEGEAQRKWKAGAYNKSRT